jgi:hypothetical protein
VIAGNFWERKEEAKKPQKILLPLPPRNNKKLGKLLAGAVYLAASKFFASIRSRLSNSKYNLNAALCKGRTICGSS